jgi:hypothetical protein
MPSGRSSATSCQQHEENDSILTTSRQSLAAVRSGRKELLMAPRLGKVVLGLSAAGFPLTQLAIRRFGRRGAIVTEGVCVGLAVRDAAMIAAGTPALLRRGPALLLWLELAAAVVAAGLGVGLATDDRPVPPETARRATVGALFALHTVRFWIYLRPDHGLTRATHRPESASVS